MPQLAVFDAQPVCLTRQRRCMTGHLVKETVLFLIRKMNDQGLRELAQQQFDFLRGRIHAFEHVVNPPQLIAQDIVLLMHSVKYSVSRSWRIHLTYLRL
jgi:hypothetical protein